MHRFGYLRCKATPTPSIIKTMNVYIVISFFHSTCRHFGHLLRYCEPAIRRAVPLALGLISVSNPQLNILDTLTKFSHDTDTEVAHNSIFALGLIGAGKLKIKLFLI